jgi:hypothetical protein
MTQRAERIFPITREALGAAEIIWPAAEERPDGLGRAPGVIAGIRPARADVHRKHVAQLCFLHQTAGVRVEINEQGGTRTTQRTRKTARECFDRIDLAVTHL